MLHRPIAWLAPALQVPFNYDVARQWAMTTLWSFDVDNYDIYGSKRFWNAARVVRNILFPACGIWETHVMNK